MSDPTVTKLTSLTSIFQEARCRGMEPGCQGPGQDHLNPDPTIEIKKKSGSSTIKSPKVKKSQMHEMFLLCYNFFSNGRFKTNFRSGCSTGSGSYLLEVMDSDSNKIVEFANPGWSIG